MEGSAAKEIGYFTAAPTAANSAELDNEALIFQQTQTSSDAAFTALVHATGNGSIVGTKTFIDPIAGSITGNAATADALSTRRIISLTGDVAGFEYFDGTANAQIETALGSTIAGDKTFSGNISVGGNLSVAGNPTCGADEIVHTVKWGPETKIDRRVDFVLGHEQETQNRIAEYLKKYP